MWSSSENQITIDVIRHGKTYSNSVRKYLGCKCDEELLEAEFSGLLSFQNHKENICPETIFVCPLKRCLQTADIIWGGADIPVICVEELKEIDFGIFEGHTYDELKDSLEYQHWLESKGNIAPPDGESKSDFITRTMNGFYKCLDALEGKTSAVIVAHGGTVMSIMSTLTDGDYYDYQVACGEGYRLIINVDKDNDSMGRNIHVVSFDRTSYRRDT